MKMQNYFKVYRNGEYVGDTATSSKRSAWTFIKTGKVVIGTHMGQWQRKINGYYYHTTVGVTVDFVRFAKLKQVQPAQTLREAMSWRDSAC